MDFGFEECDRTSLKNSKIQRKEQVQDILENEFKKLEPGKVCKYLEVEKNNNIKNKYEKEILKKKQQEE